MRKGRSPLAMALRSIAHSLAAQNAQEAAQGDSGGDVAPGVIEALLGPQIHDHERRTGHEQ